MQHASYNDFELHGIILAVRTRLKCDDEILAFDLDVDRRGLLQVQLNYSKVVTLTAEEVIIVLMALIISLLVTYKNDW